MPDYNLEDFQEMARAAGRLDGHDFAFTLVTLAYERARAWAGAYQNTLIIMDNERMVKQLDEAMRQVRNQALFSIVSLGAGFVVEVAILARIGQASRVLTPSLQYWHTRLTALPVAGYALNRASFHTQMGLARAGNWVLRNTVARGFNWLMGRLEPLLAMRWVPRAGSGAGIRAPYVSHGGQAGRLVGEGSGMARITTPGKVQGTEGLTRRLAGMPVWLSHQTSGHRAARLGANAVKAGGLKAFREDWERDRSDAPSDAFVQLMAEQYRQGLQEWLSVSLLYHTTALSENVKLVLAYALQDLQRPADAPFGSTRLNDLRRLLDERMEGKLDGFKTATASLEQKRHAKASVLMDFWYEVARELDPLRYQIWARLRETEQGLQRQDAEPAAGQKPF